MKLKAKILAVSLIPVILLGVIMFLVAADRIANGIYDEAYLGMHATTLAIRDIFETGYEGQYHLDEYGELWKGRELNISQSLDIVDHIKENTGLDVTIFWEDNRVLTSIVDEKGNSIFGNSRCGFRAEKFLSEQACGYIGDCINLIISNLFSSSDHELAWKKCSMGSFSI